MRQLHCKIKKTELVNPRKCGGGWAVAVTMREWLGTCADAGWLFMDGIGSVQGGIVTGRVWKVFARFCQIAISKEIFIHGILMIK